MEIRTALQCSGHLNCHAPRFIPPPSVGTWSELTGLFGSALAIAFVGFAQSAVITRSRALKTDRRGDTSGELVGQGLANRVAPFVSSCAGSGSPNRQAIYVQPGRGRRQEVYIASLRMRTTITANGGVSPVIRSRPLFPDSQWLSPSVRRSAVKRRRLPSANRIRSRGCIGAMPRREHPYHFEESHARQVAVCARSDVSELRKGDMRREYFTTNRCTS